jgi:NAD(P)-dependent dehydrogenase (short-subunit alcohol dehydrogenase family)
MVRPMENAVAIVTGGLRGLGKAMALGLLRAGHPVVAVGHIADDVAPMLAEAGADAARLTCLVLDLLEPAAREALVVAAERVGPVGVLVNNAGLTFTYFDPKRFVDGPKKFWLLEDATVQAVIDTNYMVADCLTRRVVPGMLSRGWGRIVNVTTKLDTMDRAGSIPYGPSKAALELASSIWAKDLAGTGVTVNVVNPGSGAHTPGMAQEMRDWSDSGKAPRLLDAEAMVPPLLFVVSHEAAAVQGWRFDATSWDASVAPVEAARRSGRRAGFLLHPVEDFSAG